MPDIAIWVDHFENGAVPGDYKIVGNAVESTINATAGWAVMVHFSDNVTQLNAAIVAAAVDAFAEIGYTIGTSDKKTVFGGPV